MRVKFRLSQQLMHSWTWSGDILILLGLPDMHAAILFYERLQEKVDLVWKRKQLLVAISALDPCISLRKLSLGLIFEL